MSKEKVTYSFSCDDCFNTWESNHEELVCPVCGSTNIFEE